MSEIKNKLKFNNEELSFQTDSTPVQASSAFITSGAVYQILQALSAFVNRSPTDVISSSNTDVVTSGAVYDALSAKVNSSAFNSLKSKVTALESFRDNLETNDIIVGLISRIEALEGAGS